MLAFQAGDDRAFEASGQRRLPLRPWLTGYARPEVRAIGVGPIDVLRAWVDVVHVSDAFWDPAGLCP